MPAAPDPSAVSEPPPPPAPEDAATWAEFTGRLRALYDWCGRPKYRALCSRCPGLSPATVSNLIGRNPLTTPSETATARFVEACLRYRDRPDPEAEVARWTAHRTLIAAAADTLAPGTAMPGTAPPDDETPDDETADTATAEDAATEETGGRGRLYAAAAAVLAAGALASGVAVFVVAGGDDGEAAEGCRPLRGTIEDSRTNQTWPDLFQCPNRPRVDVYEKAAFGTKVAVLETDPSWFICWTRGERHSGGNDVWYYTQGDRATGKPELNGWGYVPASTLRTARAPDPAITRRCA
ncbi:hypothetical protein ACFOY4_16005 [Actinomadura syzygii]|uniref:Uncharacterized protein n=1 Tax=Actinomadura syzygii TaxID=1427538 RepID=A0A5D0TZH0_9ACTN|nr:hypothetical protein [Actinomadura syzygii]TYC11538.1 hypothetical protein FXF65_25880 [Actinomadura syzygii]